jgi:hypothetical protein
MKKKTKEQFIEDARLVPAHKDKSYDYSLVDYVGNKTKVTIICKTHGNFDQKPNSHLSGKGCLKCSGKMKKTTKQFKEEALLVPKHQDKSYDYSLVNYVNNDTKVTIICKKHGKFDQEPVRHLQGHGCTECGGTMKKTTEQFKEEALLVPKHQDKSYNYSLVDYVNSKTEVTIICKTHGNFDQTPSNHLSGYGCQKCAGNMKKTTEQFIKDAQLVPEHKDKSYNYSLVNYVDNRTKVTIICNIHGNFDQTPHEHLSGCGCSKCATSKTYSKIALKWIKELEINNNIKIQSAETEEYTLDWKKYGVDSALYIRNMKLDGICHETSTVYEFHGCLYHGCPKCYEPEGISPISHTSFKILYEKTLEKERIIRKCGFTLITMWECDYMNLTN